MCFSSNLLLVQQEYLAKLTEIAVTVICYLTLNAQLWCLFDGGINGSVNKYLGLAIIMTEDSVTQFTTYWKEKWHQKPLQYSGHQKSDINQ